MEKVKKKCKKKIHIFLHFKEEIDALVPRFGKDSDSMLVCCSLFSCVPRYLKKCAFLFQEERLNNK